MSSATVSHQPLPAHRIAAPAPRQAAASAQTRELTYAEADARTTLKLAAITGAAAIVILAFFIGMMWLLAGYGPAA